MLVPFKTVSVMHGICGGVRVSCTAFAASCGHPLSHLFALDGGRYITLTEYSVNHKIEQPFGFIPSAGLIAADVLFVHVPAMFA